MEEKSLEQLKQDFIDKIAPYKQGVADEFLKRKNGYGEPEAVEGLQDAYLQAALRMIEIQKRQGYFAKKDLLPADFTKIQTTAKKFGETIDYTFSADKHHLEELERYDIESVLIRSLCGTDDYANEHRLYSSAGQSLFIFDPNYGREATYNIKFKNWKVKLDF